ncbi:MAG: hypothetical protein ABI867_42960 [Kofleriaceae bacterium]
MTTPVIDDCTTPVAYAPIRITNTRIGTYSEYIGPVGSKQGWGLIALTQPTRIDNSREDFTIGGDKGAFNTLQLRATAGSSYIRKVSIEFADNARQYIEVNRALDGRNPTLSLDLAGNNRQIKRIFVYGTTANASAYQLFAQ